MSNPRKPLLLIDMLRQALAEATAPPPPPLPPMDDPGLDPATAASDAEFNRLALEETGLQMLVLVTLPDGRLFRGWRRYDCPSQPAQVSSSLAEFMLSHHRMLSSLQAPNEDVWATLETPESLLLMRQVRLDFGIGGLFTAPANPGSARLSLRRLIKQLEPALPAPSFEVSF